MGSFLAGMSGARDDEMPLYVIRLRPRRRFPLGGVIKVTFYSYASYRICFVFWLGEGHARVRLLTIDSCLFVLWHRTNETVLALLHYGRANQLDAQRASCFLLLDRS